MTDQDDRVLLLNKEAKRVLAYTVTQDGVSKQEPLRDDWTTQLINDKLGESFPYNESLGKVRSESIVVERKEVNFNGRTLRVFVAPIVDTAQPDSPQVLGSVTLLADITEQKVMERSKEEFFSIASHELRTPLTAISGNAELILSYYKEQLKDEGLREIVDDIHESGVRLIGIVNDFLDVSRAEQGRMHYKLDSFDLQELADTVLSDFENGAKEKKISLHLEPFGSSGVPQAYADSGRVTQVIYNLLGNALKFTPAGGSVTVAIEQQPENLLKVSVKDTGMGIDPEAQRLLFHKFQQAGASLYTRRSEKGTGLGLYICKLMVTQMGGSMKIDSSVIGKGTTFSFTVPSFHGQKPAESGGGEEQPAA